MKTATSFRLSDEARALLEKLAAANSISQTAVLELLIRRAAESPSAHVSPNVIQSMSFSPSAKVKP